MNVNAGSILTLVKAGRNIKNAATEIYGNWLSYYRDKEINDTERRIIFMERQEYKATLRLQMGQKKSSGLFIAMPDDLKRKVYELCLISNVDPNRLICSMIRKSAEDAEI